MARKFFVGVDDSQNSLDALRNLGGLLQGTDIHLELFHAVPESALIYPGELSTLSGTPSDWKKVQERQARAVLEQAVSLLIGMGYKRSRLRQESVLQSVDAAQDILAASDKGDFAAIVLARKGRSAAKRFLLGSTTTMVCHYSEKQPVWVLGTRPLKPPSLLVALDESDHAGRIISHVSACFAGLPGFRITLFHVMPAKPPGYWDDGHILVEAERAERQTRVARWRAEHEEKTGGIFLKAKQALVGAGAPEHGIVFKRQTLVRGIARDILAEAGRGDYNTLVFGRRGTSAIPEFSLGSRAAKMLQGGLDCTLVLVN
ncbi:MAG TPA: universal stress protein [Syntrophobacteria bacterium]|nr:universal stress protein [Syntrophobacteria bacterium]